MREGQPSQTAIWVAFARAVSSHEHELSALCPDPLAERLVPGVLGFLVHGRDGRHRNQSLMQALRVAGLGLVDHLALRTALIDQALHAALAEGIDQVVLLGAGLDARAHRLEALRDAIVFEVDHPSTQAYKRRRAAGLPRAAREIRYAACDFESVTLDAALQSVAFDRTRPSAWIWEGVTMYLPRRAAMATLDTIAQLMTSGSVLIASYVTPELAARGRGVARIGTAMLSALNEPLRCALEPADMARELSLRGLRAQSDELPLDAALRLGALHTEHAWLVPAERIVVAKRIDV